ncbi:MAG: FAD-dependent monooxygenase [Acidiferrobacterales bacterium]|nr:FAD-dependent monooxygenase [Acidiferrobacterales bacterium]
MVDQKHDVIVVGGGLIGAAFALKLAHNSNFSILVLEQSSQVTENVSPNQRVLALGNVAIASLEEIGVFEKLQFSECYPYTSMFVWDDASAGELEFSAQDYRQTCLGYMVDANSLTMLLQQAVVAHSQITADYDCDTSELVLGPDFASVDNYQAPLIVAADGVNSWCRQQAKIFANKFDYQQRSIVARIQPELSHQDTAWQIFLQSGPIGLLPLANNECSIVWSASNDLARTLMSLSDEQFSASLCEALQDRLGKIKLLSKRHWFPLHSVKAETYFKHRLALVGDAAHAIHPLAGQGANIGFKDIDGLVEQLITIKDPDNLGDLEVLSRYQQARKADNEQTDLMMSALNKAYQNNTAWWASLRGYGMNWISNSDRIKSLLAKQGMGLF